MGAGQEKQPYCSFLSKYKLAWETGEFWGGRQGEDTRPLLNFPEEKFYKTVRDAIELSEVQGNQQHRLQKHMSGTYWFHDSVKNHNFSVKIENRNREKPGTL